MTRSRTARGHRAPRPNSAVRTRHPSMKTISKLLALCAAVAAPLPAQDLVAIRAGEVHTMTNGVLENVVVLIENGRITAVGPDVEVPWNATVVDATDKVVLPAWILAHTPGGMSGSNERMQNVPFLTVQDAVDPSSLFFEEALRNGIGTLHVIPGNSTLLGGRGMVVRPHGKTVEDMTVRDRGGLKLSLEAGRGNSRMAQMRQLRNVLEDAVLARREHERQKAEFEKMKAAGATKPDATFDAEIDRTKQPVVDLLDRELRGWLYVPSAAEIPEVERLKDKYDLDLVLVLGPRCYKAADRIKQLGYPVVLDEDAIEYTERDPETGEETVVCQAKVLADAGIEFAISVSESTSSASRYPWWQMATMVRHGVDRETAMRSLTTVPARILGMEDQFGAIAPGRIASIQVLTGDPLAATSWVDTVLLEGDVVYQRAEDKRLQHLFGESEGEK